MSWRNLRGLRRRPQEWFKSFSMFVTRSHQQRTYLHRKCFKLKPSRCIKDQDHIRHFSAGVPKVHPMNTTIEDNGKQLSVTTETGHTMRFPSIWLRFNCHCVNCKQPKTLCKLIDPVECNIHTTIESAEITERVKEKIRSKCTFKNYNTCITEQNGLYCHFDKVCLVSSAKNIGNPVFKSEILSIHWDDHQGEIPVSFLEEYQNPFTKKAHRHSWIREQTFQKMSYHDITKSESAFLKWLRKINEEGWCVLTDVPTEKTAITTVIELIGPVHSTVYGDVFQVYSEPSPTNIAYTSVNLSCHMDLLFYETPPGIQFLHCMQFDDCVKGGDSIILDVFNVAEKFRNEFPEDFDILTKVPVVFENLCFNRDDPVCMGYKRPHIVLNDQKEIINVNWSPHQEGSLPWTAKEEDMMLYYEAHQKFAKSVKHSPDKFVFRLKPGELLAVNNRTTLHGRHEFQLNGGVRWFQGSYTLLDHLINRINALSLSTGEKRPRIKIGQFM